MTWPTALATKVKMSWVLTWILGVALDISFSFASSWSHFHDLRKITFNQLSLQGMLMLNKSTMKHDIFQSSWKCAHYPADEEPLSSWYHESLAFSQSILKGKRHGTVADSVIPSQCTWSCLEVKYSRASLALGWETTQESHRHESMSHVKLQKLN